MLSIFAISSSLHQGTDVDSPDSFIKSLGIEHSFKGSDFTGYGETLSLIYVMTGGTEGIFRDLLPALQEKTRQRVLLLASDHSNSLAASVEILSYLRRKGVRGEILHGKPSYIRSRIESLEKVEDARRKLENIKLGVIGAPSDWLISSDVDREVLLNRLGIQIQDIPMEELLDSLGDTPVPASAAVKDSLPGAGKIYEALRTICIKMRLQK